MTLHQRHQGRLQQTLLLAVAALCADAARQRGHCRGRPAPGGRRQPGQRALRFAGNSGQRIDRLGRADARQCVARGVMRCARRQPAHGVDPVLEQDGAGHACPVPERSVAVDVDRPCLGQCGVACRRQLQVVNGVHGFIVAGAQPFEHVMRHLGQVGELQRQGDLACGRQPGDHRVHPGGAGVVDSLRCSRQLCAQAPLGIGHRIGAVIRAGGRSAMDERHQLGGPVLFDAVSHCCQLGLDHIQQAAPRHQTVDKRHAEVVAFHTVALDAQRHQDRVALRRAAWRGRGQRAPGRLEIGAQVGIGTVEVGRLNGAHQGAHRLPVAVFVDRPDGLRMAACRHGQRTGLVGRIVQ